MNALKGFLAPLIGLGFAVVVAVLVALVEMKWNFAIYSLTLNFIIPLGGFIVGLLAGVGYYIAARMTGQAAGTGVLLSMMAASVICYLMIAFIPYEYGFKPQFEAIAEIAKTQAAEGQLVDDDGNPIPVDDLDIRVPSFIEYLHESILNKQWGDLRDDEGIALSPFFAYASEVIIVIGFLLGALAIFAILRSVPYCHQCGRYLKKTQSIIRYPESDEAVQETIEIVANGTGTEPARIAEAIGERDDLVEKAPKDAPVQVQAELFTCPDCSNELLKFAVAAKDQNGYSPIPGLAAELWTFPPEGVELSSLSTETLADKSGSTDQESV